MNADRVCQALAQLYGWTPTEIGALTIPQLPIYCRRSGGKSGVDHGMDYAAARAQIAADAMKGGG